MSHTAHYRNADDLILHLDAVVPTLADPYLQSKYVGFLSISCVAVLELAIKTVFCDSARKKHKVLGVFCDTFFERINGRITIKIIREDYLKRFGEKYLRRFDARVEQLEKDSLAASRLSIKSSYGNLLTWRHSYAHEGTIPSNASYTEAKNGYNSGKVIIDCLEKCLVR